MSKKNPSPMERLIVKKFIRGEMKFKDAAPALGLTNLTFAFLVAFTARKFVEEFRAQENIELDYRIVDLVDKHFPKGKCKERGQAMVLVAEMLMLQKGRK